MKALHETSLLVFVIINNLHTSNTAEIKNINNKFKYCYYYHMLLTFLFFFFIFIFFFFFFVS